MRADLALVKSLIDVQITALATQDCTNHILPFTYIDYWYMYNVYDYNYELYYLLLLPSSSLQLGFGAYPVVVKKFAQQSSANPIIFSFYRLAVHACIM